MKYLLFLIFSAVVDVPDLWAEEAKKAIEVFPSTPFYRYIIYENLAIFWLAIICLIIILKMKLNEIERIQQMELDKEENETGQICN